MKRISYEIELVRKLLQFQRNELPRCVVTSALVEARTIWSTVGIITIGQRKWYETLR